MAKHRKLSDGEKLMILMAFAVAIVSFIAAFVPAKVQ